MNWLRQLKTKCDARAAVEIPQVLPTKACSKDRALGEAAGSTGTTRDAWNRRKGRTAVPCPPCCTSRLLCSCTKARSHVVPRHCAGGALCSTSRPLQQPSCHLHRSCTRGQLNCSCQRCPSSLWTCLGHPIQC